MRFSIVCGCEGWRYYQHANGAWVKIDDHEADLLALRETVRVLGEESKAWREHRRLHDERSVFSPSGRHPSPDEYNAYKEPREQAWTALCRARHEVNANPGARAAVEGTT